MSRIYTNGYRIEYPNKLAYAGMPAIVRVSQLDTAYIGVGITIKVGENYYTETRSPYNGEVVFDISRYMQLAFVGTMTPDYFSIVSESSTYRSIEVVVSLTKDGTMTNALTFQCNALYGYIGYNQANGGVFRTRKWYINLPQSFDIYASDETHITIIGDNDALYLDESVSDIAPTTIVTSPLFFDIEALANNRSAKLKATMTQYLNGDSFDDGVITETKLIIDKGASGVYLRWLDHFGHWCYYLFRVTGRSYTTKEERSWQHGILRNELVAEDGVYLQSGQPMHQLSQQESISLGAKLVDAETFDFLLSLTSSPMVDVMTNVAEFVENGGEVEALWERVSVVAGSYARTGAPLQDFSVSIVRNAQTSQML